LEVERGAAEDASTWVVLSESEWSDLFTSNRTMISLELAGPLMFRRGAFSQLVRWEGTLRALYLGIPQFDPSTNPLLDLDGQPLDLARRFTLVDQDLEMSHFLVTTGFLHVAGVLAPSEVSVLRQEADRVEAEAVEDDPFTWWASDLDGERVLCRVIYADRRSAIMGELATDPRFLRLAGLLGSPVEEFSDRMDGPTLLIKPPGELRGLSNLPWHQDCGLGGHPIICPSVSIGVQITGSTPATGCLEVIAGSHGQSVPPLTRDESMSDWPRVVVETSPGDVTIHVQDVIHSSPPPSGSGGRKTLYLSYYPPNLADHVGPGEAINDLIRGRQAEADTIGSR
jgi:hypothetical protein